MASTLPPDTAGRLPASLPWCLFLETGHTCPEYFLLRLFQWGTSFGTATTSDFIVFTGVHPRQGLVLFKSATRLLFSLW